MFTIYDNGEMSFRSTAEALNDKRKVDALAEAKLNPDTHDDNLFEDYLKSKNENNNSKEHAINAYRKVANLDTSEPVYHVEDVMSREPVSINLDASIKDTYELLKDKKVNQIPVLSSSGTIVGVIGRRFILDLIVDDIERASEVLERKLESISFDKVITVHPISDIRRVAKVMIDLRLNAVPVVNEFDTLVGVVSKTDIIEAVSHIPNFKLWS